MKTRCSIGSSENCKIFNITTLAELIITIEALSEYPSFPMRISRSG
jgi:hypothetical protein